MFLKEGQYEDLKKIAEEEMLSISHLIRGMIKEFLEKRNKKKLNGENCE